MPILTARPLRHAWRLAGPARSAPACLGLSLLLAGCASAPPPALAPAPLAAADAAVQRYVDAAQMPGAVLWIEHGGEHHERAFGRRVLPGPEAAEPMTVDTLFDAASLTKATVTSLVVEKLREAGRLDVDAPLARYLPECGGADKAAITLRELLTHSSGLRPDLPKDDEFFAGAEPSSVEMPSAQRAARIEQAVIRACALPLASVPGTQFRYSDLNYILLGAVAARVGGAPLEQLAAELVFAPLGMADSGYLPLDRGVAAARIAPTARVGTMLLRGVVHDPTARAMGGVAGHAGLFTTAADLARLGRMLLADGLTEDGRRYLSHESIVLLETPQSGLAARRSLGWDIATPFSRRGALYPKGESFGHTGFTGTLFWLDPRSRSFVILLSNRVHEPHDTNLLPLYDTLATDAAAAAGVAAPRAATP
ncbi:MAG: beta-lactamase family protein [Pelomonas sp.]|nr:beta-lactamase family protein [Roseateles sp.]